MRLSSVTRKIKDEAYPLDFSIVLISIRDTIHRAETFQEIERISAQAVDQNFKINSSDQNNSY